MFSHLVSVCLLVLVGKGFLWQTGNVWENIFLLSKARGSVGCSKTLTDKPGAVFVQGCAAGCSPRTRLAVSPQLLSCGQLASVWDQGHGFPVEVLGSWELLVCDDGTVSLLAECSELVFHLKAFGGFAPYFLYLERSDKKKATFFPRPPVETSNSNKLGYSPVPLLDGTNRSGRLSLVRDFLFQLRTPELLTALALEREQSSGCIPSPEQHQPLAHQCPCLWELLSRAMKRCLKVTSVTSHYTGNNTFGMVTVVGCFLTILIFNFILWVFLIERVWHD